MALLIYGVVLFPNFDQLIDVNVVKIFMSRNPVPTLLGDILHSFHTRTMRKRGRLPTKEDFPLVKQKVHCMLPKMAQKIKAKVMKQFNAGFLAVTSYPQWVANVVPVPKKDGKVQMCMDYRDLNRASPKDDFSLPHIDVLVEIGRAHV